MKKLVLCTMCTNRMRRGGNRFSMIIIIYNCELNWRKEEGLSALFPPVVTRALGMQIHSGERDDKNVFQLGTFFFFFFCIKGETIKTVEGRIEHDMKISRSKQSDPPKSSLSEQT